MSRAKDRDTELTARDLRRRFDYDPNTGVFRYRYRPECQGKIEIGDVAGYVREKRYLVIKIDNYPYYAHRLAWLYVYGQWPENEVDHIDLNKLNNSISNLRAATRAENRTNTKLQATSSSGYKGVTRFRCKHMTKRIECDCPVRWKAQATIDQKVVYLGLYDTKEAAHEAYCNAVREARPEFFRKK